MGMGMGLGMGYSIWVHIDESHGRVLTSIAPMNHNTHSIVQ